MLVKDLIAVLENMPDDLEVETVEGTVGGAVLEARTVPGREYKYVYLLMDWEEGNF